MPDSRCFEPATARFFRDLATHNERAWFTAHRADYDRLVREPLEALAAGPAVRYGEAHVMRPNRDVRFSADKSPYRLNGALFAGSVGAVYLHVDASGLGASGGLYEPSRDQRQRARSAIDGSPAAGLELARLVGALEADGFDLAGPSLTTAPRASRGTIRGSSCCACSTTRPRRTCRSRPRRRRSPPHGPRSSR